MQNIPLPERLEDLLADEAGKVDWAARAVIGMLTGFGYRLVMPPLAEGLDSLLAESGSDSELAARTLQLTDPLGGAPMGIRADITPQLRRIDAQLDRGEVRRLCYCGPTLYARPVNPWQSREQLQAGAELFGADPQTGSAEILMLAVRAMRACGLEDIALALGHAGIVNAMFEGISGEQAAAVRRSLMRRDPVALRQQAPQLLSLAQAATAGDLAGNGKITGLPEQCAAGLAELEHAAGLLSEAGIETIIDLLGLSGHEYHNGLTFAVLSGEGIVARGGRYGRRGRSAIGFTADIRSLAAALEEPERPAAVACPSAWHDPAWRQAVDNLAGQGKSACLYDEPGAPPEHCRERLVRDKDGWRLAAAGDK